MFTSVVAALALAASVSHVAASPVHHAGRAHAQIARGYRQDSELLEDYATYRTRYLALDCQDKSNTTQFFQDCCHPLLRTQNLSDRPAQCVPSASASTSAAAAEPSASLIDEDPVYTDSNETTSSAAVVAVTSKLITSAQPTTYKTTYHDETSSAKPTSTHRPATTYAPTTTKAATSAEATTSASSGGGADFTGGEATWFTQGGNPGACGVTHSDDDLIVAVDYRRYGSLDKKSSLCGQKVLITNTNNGKQVTCTIADACPSCNDQNSLDLSRGAFGAIGSYDDGVLPITWRIV